MNELITAEENRRRLEKVQSKDSNVNQEINDAKFFVDACEIDDLPQPEIYADDYGINVVWHLDWTISVGRADRDGWIDFFATQKDDLESTIHCKLATVLQTYKLFKLFVLHICYDD